jgi:hypothetical protein
MLEITDHSPVYIHSVNGSDLPEWMYDLLRADSMDHDYKMLDYQDGDWKYKLDLNLGDLTPVDELVKFQEGEDGYDESSYPHKSWSDTTDDFDEYIGMLLIVHHVRANVPAHVIAANLLAVSI